MEPEGLVQAPGPFNRFFTEEGWLLISTGRKEGAGCSQERTSYREAIMTDLIYIGIVVVFFAVSVFYARLCEKM